MISLIQIALSFTATKWGQVAANQQLGPKDVDMSKIAQRAIGGYTQAPVSTWLAQRIDRGEKEVFSEVTNLTPELAKELLARNEGNRPLRAKKLLQYTSDALANRWDLNGQPIIISIDGKTNDGQHRCLAVINSNSTIPVILTFGIERETRKTLDTGGTRTASDAAGFRGIENAAIVTAIARMIIAYERGNGRSIDLGSNVTISEIIERCESDPFIGVSATFGHTNQHYSKRFIAGSLLGFAHYVFSRINAIEAELFLSRLARGDGLRVKDPVYTLREKLIADGRLPRDRKIKLILQAWNFYRRNMRVAASSMNSELPFPALI